MNNEQSDKDKEIPTITAEKFYEYWRADGIKMNPEHFHGYCTEDYLHYPKYTGH